MVTTHASNPTYHATCPDCKQYVKCALKRAHGKDYDYDVICPYCGWIAGGEM